MTISVPKASRERLYLNATGLRVLMRCFCSSSTEEATLIRWLTTAVTTSGWAGLVAVTVGRTLTYQSIDFHTSVDDVGSLGGTNHSPTKTFPQSPIFSTTVHPPILNLFQGLLIDFTLTFGRKGIADLIDGMSEVTGDVWGVLSSTDHRLNQRGLGVEIGFVGVSFECGDGQCGQADTGVNGY
jgi:hypothetical protein